MCNIVVEIEMTIEVEIFLTRQDHEIEQIVEKDRIEIIVKEIMNARLLVLILEKGNL